MWGGPGWCLWGLLARQEAGLTGAGSGGRTERAAIFLSAAQGFVDGLGVGEGVEQVGRDEDDIGAGLHAGVVLAAHAFAEVEVGRGASGSSWLALLIRDILARVEGQGQIESFRALRSTPAVGRAVAPIGAAFCMTRLRSGRAQKPCP